MTILNTVILYIMYTKYMGLMPILIFPEVLSEMAGIFSPQQFLQLLPADGNFYFFMPFIQLSRDKHLCHLLGQKIMSKGANLEQCL